MTKEQALVIAQARLRMQNRQRAESQVMNDSVTQGALQGGADRPFQENFNAGLGKMMTDVGRAGAQLVGMGPSAEEVQELRKRDAPLMKSGGGFSGNLSGNVMALAPLALVPGANTVAGAGTVGAITGALQPTATPGERLTNMAVGGGTAAGVQALAGPLAQKLGERAAQTEVDLARKQSQNTVRDETIRAGHEAGYVLPPSAVNQPSFIGGRMESLGGKAALKQEASLRNQNVTDDLARRAAGLGPDEAISMPALKAARHRMSAPYKETAALSPQAAADLDMVKAAKLESKLQWTSFNKSGDVNAFKAAQAADQQAEAALNRIEQQALSAGRPELVQALKQARVDIARNHEVRNAVNVGSGNVDASIIGRALDRNPERFSGELKTIGSFQQSFPQFTTEASKVPAPGVGKTELLASALLAGGGGMATGDPIGMLAGLAPFASGPARSLLLSKAVQGAVANPSYQPGVTTRAAAALNDPATREKIALLARSLALPSIPLATTPQGTQ